MSHGDPELVPPPPGPISEEWELYLAAWGPLEVGMCQCEAECLCPGYQGEDDE